MSKAFCCGTQLQGALVALSVQVAVLICLPIFHKRNDQETARCSAQGIVIGLADSTAPLAKE